MRYENLKRYKKIGEVLVRYGFTFIAEKLVENGYMPKLVLNIKESKENLSNGEKLRLACEELGPTFIKLGQIMSTRRDLFSEDIIIELSKLQDDVEPFTFEIAKEIFKQELQVDIDESFKSFNPVPIASASIGQVYGAILKNGKDVVVKIQRPLVDNIIKRDVDILFTLAKILDEHMDKEKPYELYEMVEEFARTITRELDYTLEARNAEKFHTFFQNDKNIYIPKVYWEYTSKKILTMERITGIKINDKEKLNGKNWPMEDLATIITDAFLKQIFVLQAFHGDPHPGNIFIMESNKIAFIDFGIIGYIDRDTMNFIFDLFVATTRKNIDRIISLLIVNDTLSKKTNIRRLKEDISYILNIYYDIPLKRLNLGELLKETMNIAYTNKIKLPSQFTILLKAMVTFEGSIRFLNPNFSISNYGNNFVKRMYLHKINPQNIGSEIKNYSEYVLYSIKYLPRQIRNLINKLDNNEIKLQVEEEGFEKLQNELSHMTNKLSLSLITSALIVGSSLIIQIKSGPTIWGVSIFGIMGYLVASFLGIVIIISILIDIIKKTNR
ncbi:MAG: ubiquinone biosynthesis protein UbiB [Clostridiales bacterium]|nr:ubiquinone biosynthesis protein UbiB [Clostridiales bacterium]